MIFAGIHNISKVRELGRLGGMGMDNGAPQRGGKVCKHNQNLTSNSVSFFSFSNGQGV